MSCPSLFLSSRHIASSGEVRTSFEIHSYYILNRSSMVSPNSAIPHTPFRLSGKMRPGPCYTCSHEETHPPQPGGILAKFPNSESCRLYRSYITQKTLIKKKVHFIRMIPHYASLNPLYLYAALQTVLGTLSDNYRESAKSLGGSMELLNFCW